jgi:hypothetical protein
MSRAEEADWVAAETAEAAYVDSRSLVAAEAEGDERAVEAALRPRSLDEVIGQERVREQLSLVLQAARSGQDHPGDDHRGGDEQPVAADLRTGDHACR